MNPSLRIEAETTAVTPGTAVAVPVRIQNTGDTTMQVLVRLVGVEETWTPPPMLVGPLEPGVETVVQIPITIPVGYPACDHLGGVEAEPIDAETGAPLGRAIFHEVVLEIGDGSLVRATIEPADVHGGGRGKFRLSLRNRGRHPLNVKLEGGSPGEMLQVRFEQDEVVLPPGEFVNIRAKVRGSRPLLGPYRRLPFVVTVRSRGTPRHLDGSFTQSPTLKSGFIKVLAIIAMVAMWASLLVFAVGRVNPPKKNEASPAATVENSTSSEDPATGDAGGEASGDPASEGGGDAAGESTAETAPTGAGEVRVGGKVTGADPSGATVSIEPTSLVDEEAQGATFVGDDGPSDVPTMHYGHFGVKAPSLVAAAQTTVTDQDGAWAFGGIRAPGFYLVIISKSGYATQKFVITAPEDGSPVVLDTELAAGDGALGGTVFGPDDQPLGGVDLTITDGTITLKTITPTSDSVGQWAVTGLTTPGTYLVTASRRGFGDETRLVELGAGGSVDDADLQMHAGVGSISGLVSSIAGPVGGIDVKVSDGQNEFAATTLTADPKGTYSIPQLPIPATYTLTVSGPGWVTQTQQVDLEGPEEVNALLTESTGSLSGVVVDGLGAKLDGVGITISNETVTLKTTSATDGTGEYVQQGIPPGNYKVTFEKFAFATQSSFVDISAGLPSPLNMVMPAVDPASLELKGQVAITVVDQKTGDPLTTASTTTTTTLPAPPVPPLLDVEVRYTEEDGTVVNRPTQNGVAIFDGVTPGLKTFIAHADSYKDTPISVQVIPNLQVTGTVVLPKNAIVTGIVRDARGTPITVPGMQVVATPITGAASQQVSVGDGGRYTFDGTLTEGAWSLVASGSDYKPNNTAANPPVTVIVTASQTLEVPITLHQLGKLQVGVQTVNAAGGVEDLTGAVVAIAGPTIANSQTVTTGSVLFTALDAGQYTITVTSGGSSRVLSPVSFVNEDATTETSVVFGALDVKVQTLDAGGTAIAGPNATVSISGPNGFTAGPTEANNGAAAFFGGLPAGAYNITVTTTGASPFSQTLSAVVSNGQFAHAALVLGRLEVTVQTPGLTGVLTDLPNATVTLTKGLFSATANTPAGGGPAVFSGLEPGVYTVQLGTQTQPNVIVGNGSVTRTGLVSSATPASNLTGRVVWSLNNATLVVPNAAVRVDGITGYSFRTTAVAPFFTFDITRGSVNGTFDALGNFTVVTSGFKFARGDITISAPNFTAVGGAPTLIQNNVSISGSLGDVFLAATPGTLAGTVTLVGAGGDTPNNVVTASITEPLGTGITLSVDSLGLLHVNDPSVVGTDKIRPGTFTIAFSAENYDAAPSTQQVTINPNQISTANVTLTKRARLPVNVFCRNTVASGLAETNARVRVTLGTGPSFTYDQTLLGGSPLTFENLTPGVYSVTAWAPGCDLQAAPTPFTLASGDSAAQNVTLTKLGTISGTLTSKNSEADLNSLPMGDRTVTLTGSNALNPLTTNPLSTTTNALGQFTFEGTMTNSTNPAGDRIGLMDDTYTIAVNPFPTASHALSTANNPIPTVTVLSHSNEVQNIVLIARRATVTGTVRDTSSTGPVINGVTVTATTSQVPGGRSVTVQTNSDGIYTFSNTDALEPVLWSFNFSVPNFAPLGQQITLLPGAALTNNVTLAQQRNTIRGVTSTKFGSASAVAEGGVTVTITNVNNASDQHVRTSSLSSGSIGAFEVTGLLNGSYLIDFHKDGFADFNTQAAVSAGQVFVQNATLNVIAVPTTVTVKSEVEEGGNKLSISGTTVTLTPKSTPVQRSATTFTAVTNGSGVASFNPVLPSTYTISISAVGGHLTVLDVNEMTIAVDAASASQAVDVQEARLRGRVLVQDTATTPTTGTSGLTVKISAGSAALVTPTTTATTGSDGLWSKFVTPNGSTGYTVEVPADSDHVPVAPDSSTATTTDAGDDHNFGNITLVKYATLTVLVQLSSGASVTDAEVTIKRGGDDVASDAVSPYVFKLVPDLVYSAHAERPTPPPPSSSSSSSSSGAPTTQSGSTNVSPKLDPGESRSVTVTIS